MAALPGLRSETPSTVALSGTVGLGELLTVGGAFSPAAGLAGLVTRGAVSLRLGEVVHVDVLRPRASDDLLPFDRLDVTQVVVVQDAHAALEDIWGGEVESENDVENGVLMV